MGGLSVTTYFHVTEKDFGTSIVLKPRVPDTQDLSEGNIPRICVCPTVFDCVAAKVATRRLRVHHVLNLSNCVFHAFETIPEFVSRQAYLPKLYVYETGSTPYLPPDSFDFRKHREHWFIKPTKFYRIGHIDYAELLKSRKLTVSMYSMPALSSELLKEHNRTVIRTI